MAAVWMRLRAEARARWRAWLALAVVLGLAAGATITAAAGARRSETAFPRFVAWSNPFHTSTGGVAAGEQEYLRGLAAMERLPQVADSVRYYSPALEIREAGSDVPIRNLAPTVFPPEVARRTTFRFKFVRGRAPRPDRPDEATIGFTAETDDLGIGDVVDVPLYRDQENPIPERIVPVRIVGVHATPDEFPSIAQISFPSLVLSPAFYTQHKDLIPDDSSRLALAIHLKKGAAGFAEFRAAVIEARIPINLPLVLSDTVSSVRKTLRFESSALWLLAGLLGLATLAILGQALSRQTTSGGGDNSTLWALGLTPRQMFRANLVRTALIGAAAAVVAVPTAILASPLTPIGIGRIAEPQPGFRIDGLALLIGAGSTIVLVVVAGIPASFRAAHLARIDPIKAQEPAKRSRMADLLARAGASPSLVSGARMATEAGRRARATPVRSAIVGASLGIGALIMSFVFATSLHRLVDEPHLSGIAWDQQVAGTAEARAALEMDPRVLEVQPGGFTGIDIAKQRMLAITYEEKGSIRPVIAEGRVPRGPDEIALGRTTMRSIGAHIGSKVRVFAGRSEGEDPTVEQRSAVLTVVGRVVIPALFFESHEPGVGAAFTIDALKQIAPPREGENTYLIRFFPGVTIDDVMTGPFGEQIKQNVFFVVPKQGPADLDVLKGVSDIPIVLAGLLGLMAAATLAHSLVTSVRSRRVDIAILKTLGFDRSQARATIAWQTSLMLVVALVIGLPAGVAAGRWGWRAFVEGLALLPDPRISMATVALIPPIALLLANLIAAIPARAAALTRPALILRTE